MVGEILTSGYCTEAETAGVIVAHLSFVVGIVFVGQAYLLNWVMLTVKLHEDAYELLGDDTVAYHLSIVSTVVVVPVHQAQVTEVVATDDIIGLPCSALHLMPYGIGNFADRESRRKILALRRKDVAEPECK